jgi:hypothetical protein
MDIKPTNPGQANWKPAVESESVKQPAKPAADAPQEPLARAGAAQGPLRVVHADFKRADLNTDRWNTILNRSVNALVDSASDRMGGLPESARQKIADLLAADPIFCKRVSLYLDKNLE